MLDIKVAGAIAPSAKIVVYFAPNTDAGFLDAISAAIHDTTNKPSVISISELDRAGNDCIRPGVPGCRGDGDNGLRGVG